MRISFLMLLSFLFIFPDLLLATGIAEDNPNSVQPLIVGMDIHHPPFEMSTPGGDPAGISVGIARAFGDYLGRPVQIRNTEWTSLIPALRTGNVDVVISSMTITEELSQQVDFSVPYAQSGLTLLASTNSDIVRSSDLNEACRVIAVKSGTTGADVAHDQMPLAEIRYFDNVSACVLEVSQGKADAFICDALAVYENWNKNPGTTRVILDAIPGTSGYWGAAFPKGSDLKVQMDAFILEFRTDGGFDRLAEEYLGEMRAAFDELGVPFFFNPDQIPGY